MDDCEIIYLGVKFFVFIKQTLLVQQLTVYCIEFVDCLSSFFLIKDFLHECEGPRTLQSDSLDSCLVQCDEQLKKHSLLRYLYYKRKSCCSSPSFNLNKNWTNETLLGQF